MSKIRFTKGELKRQRDALKQFEHYLPFLQLKKQQLQLEMQRVYREISLKLQQIDSLKDEINKWAGLLNEGTEEVARWIRKVRVVKTGINIAGVDLPVIEWVDF